MVYLSLGLGLISSPRRRVAAMMQAAINSAPRSLSSGMKNVMGEQIAKVQHEVNRFAIDGDIYLRDCAVTYQGGAFSPWQQVLRDAQRQQTVMGALGR